MKIGSVFFILLGTLLCYKTYAHNGHRSDRPVLHVNNGKWPECAIELDPSLTQKDIRNFGKEAFTFIYFKGGNSAKIFKKGHFEISMPYIITGKINDASPHWNNTFTHPDSVHWLVNESKRLKYPQFNFRIGIAKRIDLGVTFIKLPNLTNYGFTGIDLRYALIADSTRNFYLTSRASFGALLGVNDLKHNLIAADVSITKSFSLFSPYLGLSFALSNQKEFSPLVVLNREWIPSVVGIIGTEFNYRVLSIGAECNISKLNMYSIKVGVKI